MMTPREEFFRAWAASDPGGVWLPTLSLLLSALVFGLAVWRIIGTGRGLEARLALLPLETDSSSSKDSMNGGPN